MIYVFSIQPRPWELARMNVALRLNRFPELVAWLLTALSRKRIRDGAQAEALVRLVEERLPAFPFDPRHLRMFPQALRHGAVVERNPFWQG